MVIIVAFHNFMMTKVKNQISLYRHISLPPCDLQTIDFISVKKKRRKEEKKLFLKMSIISLYWYLSRSRIYTLVSNSNAFSKYSYVFQRFFDDRRKFDVDSTLNQRRKCPLLGSMNCNTDRCWNILWYMNQIQRHVSKTHCMLRYLHYIATKT